MQFFVPANQIKKGKILITGDEAKHIRLVLRHKIGDKIIIADGQDEVYKVEISGFDKDKIETNILEKINQSAESKIEITIIQGLPKQDKMDFIVQKCAEAGVFSIIPVITERTIVKYDSQKLAEKQIRWQKISREAAKQCGRQFIPQIYPVVDFNQAVRQIPGNSLKLIPWENIHKPTLKEVLQENKKILLLQDREVYIFIGPEGGFSNQEIETAQNKGIIPISLGRLVLRTETAGLACLFMINYELEMTRGEEEE